jgi:exodeoxyribonuclease-1
VHSRRSVIIPPGRVGPANGITHNNAHDAMADVEATLEVSRLVRERAPDLWSHLLTFKRKSAVRNFIARERAFLCLGRPGEPVAVAAIGQSARFPNVLHCLDLRSDPRELDALSTERLAAALSGPTGLLRKLKTNSAPLLWPLRDAPAHLLAGKDAGTLLANAHALQQRPDLVRKLLDCAESCARIYPPSAHVEGQLYESGFWSDRDANLLAKFHSSSWEDRPSLLRQLTDPRLRRLGWRLVFFERPDLLDGEARELAAKAMALRLLGLGGRDQPWLSVPDALLALDGDASGDDRDDGELGSYRARLTAWLISSAAVLDEAQSCHSFSLAAPTLVAEGRPGEPP